MTMIHLTKKSKIFFLFADSIFIDECNNNRKYNNYKAYKLIN